MGEVKPIPSNVLTCSVAPTLSLYRTLNELVLSGSENQGRPVHLKASAKRTPTAAKTATQNATSPTLWEVASGSRYLRADKP